MLVFIFLFSLCSFVYAQEIQSQCKNGCTNQTSNSTIGSATMQTSDSYWAPWVTKTTTNSATINWRGQNDGSGLIDYATSSYFNRHHHFEKTIASSVKVPYQHVRLAGLKPNTSYTYRVRPSGNENAFDNRMFRTMPLRGPFTFVVISDSQEGHNYDEMKRFRPVADAVSKEKDVLFVLHGGDYAGHDSGGLWGKFFQAGDNMLAKFAIFTTIGNHEYHNSSGVTPTAADQYHWAFDVPLHYSFNCAGIRFIVLDTPDPNNASGDDPHTSPALTQSQESWLRKELDNNKLGKFVIEHHPIWDHYSPTINLDLGPWEDLYHTYGISANFAGHTHNYQRFQVGGIPYFIIGNAGGRFSDLNSTDPYPIWYRFGKTRELGYLKVTVYPGNNTAIAREIFAAHVNEDDDDETPQVYDPPVVAETMIFPLKHKCS